MFLISVIKAGERKRKSNKQCENVIQMEFTLYNIYGLWDPNRFAIYDHLVADSYKTFVYVLIGCVRAWVKLKHLESMIELLKDIGLVVSNLLGEV